MDIISLLIYAHRTDSYHKEIQLLLVKEYLKLFFFYINTIYVGFIKIRAHGFWARWMTKVNTTSWKSYESFYTTLAIQFHCLYEVKALKKTCPKTRVSKEDLLHSLPASEENKIQNTFFYRIAPSGCLRKQTCIANKKQ